jgi:hypothetical protein
VIASAAPPTARPLTPDKTEPSHDSVDTRIFGTRRHYSMLPVDIEAVVRVPFKVPRREF